MIKLKQKRQIKTYECLECGEKIKGPAFGKHIKKHGYENTKEYKIKFKLIKTQEDLKNEGAVCCSICNFYGHDLNSHIIRLHKISIPDYKSQYNSPIKSDNYLKKQSDRMKGSNNPWFEHGGKFSPFSDKFIYADKIVKEKLYKKVSKSNRENGNNDTTAKYWISRGYTVEEAKEKISKRQSTFSLEKCIQNYGEKQGKERWLERQKKWHKNYKKQNFSKISQELFWFIVRNLDDLTGIYFAELDENKKKDMSGKNWEYTLKLDNSFIKPDFYIENSNKIIEFDGTYWHNNNKIRNTNKNRENVRDQKILKNGFKVLHIKEELYKENKEKIIRDCLEFIYG